MLCGTLKETLYDWPSNSAEDGEGGEATPMKMRETLVYGTDDVTYINS